MRVLSGIKPTNKLHIGNLFGVILQWSSMLEKDPKMQAVFMVVDMHAITVEHEPKQLHDDTYSLVATYLASGIDFKKHIIFIQSQNFDHPYLSWILTCITPMGWLKRMTQYKDLKQKIDENHQVLGTGVFMYPVLMAADILLYDTDIVPVGEDQIQHVELTRDIAKRFNKKFGETFVVPKYQVSKVGYRIKDLRNPLKKMSKSDATGKGVIFLTDKPDEIYEKITKATTDNIGVVKYDKINQPGISNLLEIMSLVTKTEVEQLVNQYKSYKYSDFKKQVADAVIQFLKPYQQKINDYLQDKTELETYLQDGLSRAKQMSSKKIDVVKKKVGFVGE